ncbi:DUF2169 domain-containing protein [Sorangium sp. So ce429]
MDVLSTCPLRVAARTWQSLMSSSRLTVVCKATYLLAPGLPALHQEQLPPREADAYWDDRPDRSLAAPSDLVPFKPRADVLLLGSAHAPAGKPVRSIPVRLCVGALDKALVAFGDRFWTRDGRLLDGPAATRIPLRYERAAGGPFTWNPAGIPRDARPDPRGLVPLPNLQPPGLHVTTREQRIEPIGFGPIAPQWPMRQEKLARCPGWHMSERWYEHPLPEGFDPGFFNAAPPDQQLQELRGAETILLEHLHPEHPRLATRLPGARPRAVVERDGAPPEELRLTCDTLVVDTDLGLLTLVWRGLIRLREPDEPGRVTVTLEEPAAERPPIRVEPECAEADPPSHEDDDAIRTVAVSLMSQGPVLPIFLDASRSAGVADALRAPAYATPVATPVASSDAAATSTRWLAQDTGTVAAPLLPSPMRLPFEPTAFIYPLPPQPGPAPVEAWETPFLRDPPPALEASPPPTPPPAASAPQAAPVSEPQQPAVDLTMDECAAIAAEMDRQPGSRAQILEARGLTEAEWAAHERRWAAAVDEATSRDEVDLLRAYDSAYVACIERGNGPIRAEDYARLLAGAGRRTPRPLDGLDLPQGGLLRLRRFGARKMAQDPAFAAQLLKAIQRPG